MADRPILFNAPMIKALLAGRKTIDRRVLKPQPFMNGIRYDASFGDIICHCDELPASTLMMRKGRGKNAYTASILEDGPEGMSGLFVGDRLWVREAWCAWSQYDDTSPARIPSCTDVQYAADEPISPWVSRARPSTHMPRWASRLTLEVTDVKVERLHDISEEDAVAEGCLGRLGPPDEWDQSPREEFGEVWKESYGVDAWVANPWVAAISFVVHHTNIDTLARKEAAE